MADQDYVSKPLINQVAVGVDESNQELEPGPEWDSILGLFPVFHEIHEIRIAGQPSTQDPHQGVLQRLAGKRLIDANSNQKVFAIAQAFNGFGQFGYYVQTNQKLYFHTCESPKDLHIDFATLQNLGVDSDNFSLDIFGAQLSSNAAVPDSEISCVFEFPVGDKPAPPNNAHAGVDFIIISVKPANAPNVDSRLRSRLVSLNSGTPYDNIDIGFYKTQNGCRQDSIPLVDGTDGSSGFPPTNSKYAFLAWGGIALFSIWNPISSTIPNSWNSVTTQLVQGTPPAGIHSTWYWNNKTERQNEPGVQNSGLVGGWGYEADNATWWQLKHYATWLFANTTDMQNASVSSGQVGQYAHILNTNSWYQLAVAGGARPYSLSFQDDVDRQNYPAIPTDVNAIAYQRDNGLYWQLGDMNRHLINTDYREYYLINLNRLFTDYQQVAPVSLQFLLRGYWDVRKNGSGLVNIVATSFKGGLVVRSDSVVWGISGGVQQDNKLYSPTCNRVVGNQLQITDAQGDNLAVISITMADGIIDITAPVPNADGATLCPY